MDLADKRNSKIKFNYGQKVSVHMNPFRHLDGEIVRNEKGEYHCIKKVTLKAFKMLRVTQQCYLVHIPELRRNIWHPIKYTFARPDVPMSPYRMIQKEMAMKELRKKYLLEKRREREEPLDNDSHYNNDFGEFMSYGMKYMAEKYGSVMDLNQPGPSRASNEMTLKMRRIVYKFWDHLNYSPTYIDKKLKIIDWSKDEYHECQELKINTRKYTTKIIKKRLLHITWCYVCCNSEPKGSLIQCDTCTASYHPMCCEKTRSPKCPQCVTKKDFTYDDIVWHKMKRYAWWPAKIIPPNLRSPCLRSRPSPYHYPLSYYNSDTYSWAVREEMCHFLPGHAIRSRINQRLSYDLRDAITEALEELEERTQ